MIRIPFRANTGIFRTWIASEMAAVRLCHHGLIQQFEVPSDVEGFDFCICQISERLYDPETMARARFDRSKYPFLFDERRQSWDILPTSDLFDSFIHHYIENAYGYEPLLGEYYVWIEY